MEFFCFAKNHLQLFLVLAVGSDFLTVIKTSLRCTPLRPHFSARRFIPLRSRGKVRGNKSFGFTSLNRICYMQYYYESVSKRLNSVCLIYKRKIRQKELSAEDQNTSFAIELLQ